MSRIVLFSFLGTGFYDPHIYTYGDKACKETNYTQVAIYEILKELHEDVEVFIFLTEQARKLNWQDGYREKKENGVKKEVFNVGLKNELYKRDPHITLHDITIPGSGDIEKSWELFDILLEHIEENDTVYFDMTHGFRSTPFISFIVLQYARKLKNITFGGLLYGEIDQNKKNGKKFGRIVDFTEMTSLVEWAEGVNQYIQTGNARIISEQVNREKRDLFQRHKLSKDESKYVSSLSKIANQMKSVSDSFETSRGVTIFKELERLRDLVENFETLDANYLKALVPLLDKVEAKLAKYEHNEASRVKFVVDWCIEHGLIQQGYTFLVEYVISAICDYARLDKSNVDDRQVVSATISNIERDRDREEWSGNENFKERCSRLEPKIKQYKSYFVIFSELNDYRNDINHGGKRKGSFEKKTLINKLPQLRNAMYNLIQKLYGQEVKR